MFQVIARMVEDFLVKNVDQIRSLGKYPPTPPVS